MSDDRASRIRQGRNRNKNREKDNSSKNPSSNSSPKSDNGSSYTKGDVRNRKSKNMYLPQEQIKAIDDLFKEAEFRLQKDHDLQLKKNKDFYPVLVQVALDNFDLDEFLEQQQREKESED